MPAGWTLSTAKDFPKADHSIPLEERLAILETAVIEILTACDTCQQGLWYGTQCSELSHRILIIALNQAYPVIPLNRSFIENVKKPGTRLKNTPISPRWITQYRDLWGLDWKAAYELVQKGLTPRLAYAAAADELLSKHHLKPDVVVRVVAARQPKPNVPDPLEEGRLSFPEPRSLLLAAVTAKGLSDEMPIEITYEEQSSLVAPGYVRARLRERLTSRGIAFIEEVPLGAPAAPIGT